MNWSFVLYIISNFISFVAVRCQYMKTCLISLTQKILFLLEVNPFFAPAKQTFDIGNFLLLDNGHFLYMSAAVQLLKKLDTIEHYALYFITACSSRVHHCTIFIH